MVFCIFNAYSGKILQESRAVARKPRDDVVVLFGIKFADNIHYKFKSNQKSDPTPISPEFWGCFPWTRLPMLALRGAKTLS